MWHIPTAFLGAVFVEIWKPKKPGNLGTDALPL